MSKIIAILTICSITWLSDGSFIYLCPCKYPLKILKNGIMIKQKKEKTMLKDITLGQFYPTNSVVHRLDPRVKILMTFFIIITLFMLKSLAAYVFAGISVFVIILLSRVPFSFVYKGVKPLVFILLFTAILNVFMTDGRVAFQFWIFKATYEGIYYAVAMMTRLVLLVFVTSILTLTTSPIVLTNGIEKLLNPLKKIKLPVHELAMMMTIALRFIPTLLEETDKIIKAQNSRGADFSSGNIIKKAKAMIPILIPLFISAFRRADELASAMECRCYRGGEGRTSFRVLKLGNNDWIASLIVLLFCVLAIVLNLI